ncbi:MAG: hypothetical protein Q9209_006086 [Squamulea sp. 1 TL-2023]
MRLALQRLLAYTDALRCLRNTLLASDDIVGVSVSGTCSNCRRRLGLGEARPYFSFTSSSNLHLNRSHKRALAKNGAPDSKLSRRPLLPQANNNTTGARSESIGQSSDKKSEFSKNHLDGHVFSHRERIIWRLLDEPKSHNDSLLWLELAHTRRRAHGVEGVRLVWKAILERYTKLPTMGVTADALWDHLLQLGYQDPDVLKQIFIYAWEQKENHGRTWQRLYLAVVGHYLQENPDRAWLCHMSLHKHLPPSSQHIKQLLPLALRDEKLRQLFLSIHKCFPHAHIYDIAIPELCKQGLYATAVIWHKKLIDRKDLPSSAKPTEPVMQYLAATGQKARLTEYTQLMVAGGVSFKPYNTRDMLVSPAVSHISIDAVENENDVHPKNEYSDQFCARLMATRFFSIDNIIRTLSFLGIQEIGPLTLREMATRELSHNPYCGVMQARLEQLSNTSISTGHSTFSILVRRLAAKGQSHLLANLVSCDLHTDTFDDHKLQESLLTFYHENGDAMAFNRTMAILLARLSERTVVARRWNLILRSYSSQQEFQAVKNTIEKMQGLQIQIEPKSTAHMRQTILSPRRTGRRPADTKEVDLLVRIWQDVLRSGGLVPPYIWTEIFRRLGMSGHLIAFERLALWVAAWYSSPDHRISLSCLLTQSEGDAEPLHPSMTIDLKSSNPLHPLHVIFGSSMQQAIVAWGFQHTLLNLKRTGMGHRCPDWTWGLTLLRKLRDSNVYIRKHNVSKAFKLRLIGLFGPGDSKRRINRAIRQSNRESLGAYIGRGKEIWGSDLLLRRVQRRLGQEETNRIPHSNEESR